MPWFTDGMASYAENQILTKRKKKKKPNLLEPESNCGNVVGYKINIPKSVVFLYTENI
jgi:hypothetical protein